MEICTTIILDEMTFPDGTVCSVDGEAVVCGEVDETYGECETFEVESISLMAGKGMTEIDDRHPMWTAIMTWLTSASEDEYIKGKITDEAEEYHSFTSVEADLASDYRKSVL